MREINKNISAKQIYLKIVVIISLPIHTIPLNKGL